MTESNANYITLKQNLGISLAKMDIRQIPDQFLDNNQHFKFKQFNWGNRTEQQASFDAMNHLKSMLKSVVVYDDSNKKRYLFNRDGFTFHDVHQSNKIGFFLDGTHYSGK